MAIGLPNTPKAVNTGQKFHAHMLVNSNNSDWSEIREVSLSNYRTINSLMSEIHYLICEYGCKSFKTKISMYVLPGKKLAEMGAVRKYIYEGYVDNDLVM